MPSSNPKHRKKISQTKGMGRKGPSQNCFVGGCSKEASNHVAKSNIDTYQKQLKWTLDLPKKTKRIALCKNHHKEYKKLKKKDEKQTQYRDFGPKKKPKNSISHKFLE